MANLFQNIPDIFSKGPLGWVRSFLAEVFTIPAFSSNTLIMLSLFSWLMAVPTTGLVENLLANWGWIFLIVGIYWATSATKALRIGDVPLSPWITGAVVSIYIFGMFTGELSPQALVSWPMISAVIAALPACLDSDLRLRVPAREKRQNLTILFTSQLVISCWFQFYFLLDNWLLDYPTLLRDNFQQSAFVIKVGTPASAAKLPRGALFLDLMGAKLENELNGRPWSEIERILLPQEREQLLENIREQVRQQMALDRIEEDQFWQLNYKNPSIRGTGYNLELEAIWQGPRSRLEPHSITKSCQINPVNAKADDNTILVSSVKCQAPTGWGIGESFIAIK